MVHETTRVPQLARAWVRGAAAGLAGIDPTDAYVWIAAESAVAKALRARVLDLGFSAKAMKAAGYWRLGGVAYVPRTRDSVVESLRTSADWDLVDDAMPPLGAAEGLRTRADVEVAG